MVKKTKNEATKKLQQFESLMLSKEKIQKIKGGVSENTLPTSGRLDTIVIDDVVEL
jgi:hypothetical protein